MIDTIKAKLSEAGLKFNLDRVKTQEVDFLPDAASFDGRTIYMRRRAGDDAKLHDAIAAIAMSVFLEMDDERLDQWRLALFSPVTDPVAPIEAAMAEAGSFEDAVGHLDSPVTRLLAVHLFNALLKSGMSFEDAKGVDLASWGGTASLCSGQVRASLLPLLGAYAPARLYNFFPDAVAALVTDGLKAVAHTEVRAAFAGVIREAFNKPEAAAAR